MSDDFERLMLAVRACAICRDAPRHGPPLAHDPRPVIQASPSARICIVGQAPGVRAHKSGKPYTDPSGVRLRRWLALDEVEFYDARSLAIAPMGFCFPGGDGKGGDLPPRRECAETWRGRVMARLPYVELTLLVGGYAQRGCLEPALTQGGVTETVRRWRQIYQKGGGGPRLMPLPHPSWRNNGWLGRHPWFEAELLPTLREDVRAALGR